MLGAHWPSDIWVAYLIGLVWIGTLMPLSRGDIPARAGNHSEAAGSIDR